MNKRKINIAQELQKYQQILTLSEETNIFVP